MPISSESRGQIVILRPHGHIDKSMAAELEEQLDTAIDDGAVHLVLDFSGVGHVGSDGLKAILVVLRRLQQQGGRLVQTGTFDEVRALFAAAGFRTLISEFETVDAAVAFLQTLESGPEPI